MQEIYKVSLLTLNIIKRSYLWLLVFAVFLFGVLASEQIKLTWEIFQEDGWYLIKQHLQLVLYSGGAAILIGIPFGIWLSRSGVRAYANMIMQTLNIGSAVPTLAIIALSMSFLGIGAPPAVFALTIASLLPIVRNTFTGMTAVSPALIEAAEGMGMTSKEILFKVEIPNALYVIFAGVRTALAINVGTVPLAFLIGGGGLGELIFTGIDLNEPAMLLAGAIPTALLAMCVDALITQIGRVVIPAGVYPSD